MMNLLKKMEMINMTKHRAMSNKEIKRYKNRLKNKEIIESGEYFWELLDRVDNCRRNDVRIIMNKSILDNRKIEYRKKIFDSIIFRRNAMENNIVN